MAGSAEGHGRGHRGIDCSDWQGVDAGVLDDLYQRECVRWHKALGWDRGPFCAAIEDARVAGDLPGLVVRDDLGDLVGWGFFALHDDVLHIGALIGDSATAVRRLLDRMMASPEASCARSLSCFLFPDSSALAALQRRRFRLRPHLYMRRRIGSGATNGLPACRRWDLRDGPATVRLLANAYEGLHDAASFAPKNTFAEWARYLARLFSGPGAGRVLPEASFAIGPNRSDGVTPATGPDTLAGMLLTTAVSSTTAHIAQLAVAVDARRHGLGGRLVLGAFDVLHQQGYQEVSLLVAEDNLPAQRLYERLGFRTVARFVSGQRPRPARTPPIRACRPVRRWRAVAR